jgi:hypothetical protein
MFSSFDNLGRLIDRIASSNAEPAGRSAEQRLLLAETKMGCMSGMPLFLDRPERMTPVLGGFFGVGSPLGGELLKTTPENFRRILSRSRKRLDNFMNDKCGLMNEANPRRCDKKIESMISAGLVNPDKPRFDMRDLGRVRDFVVEHADLADSALGLKLNDLPRGQPMYEPPDLTRVLAVMLKRGALGRIMDWA